MSRGRKSNYPERPAPKGRPKSSNREKGKKKAWLSDLSIFEGGLDKSPRLQFPWWKAPIYKEARIKKWSNL